MRDFGNTKAVVVDKIAPWIGGKVFGNLHSVLLDLLNLRSGISQRWLILHRLIQWFSFIISLIQKKFRNYPQNIRIQYV